MDRQLPFRRLGNSDMDLTPVGLGAWAIGGSDSPFGWGPQDDKESIATIHYAVDCGLNWVDTAPIYGLGHSEEIVGEALRQLSAAERPYVFTKCGLRWDQSDSPTRAPINDLSPQSIRTECDASLARLGIERIDLYQFHWPDDRTAVEDSWATMQELIREGKVRYGGTSNFSPELLDRCESLAPVTSLQPPLSLINRQSLADVLPWCASHGTGVLCYSPMQSGLLTEQFSVERVDQLAADDWRRRASDFRSPGLERNIALRDALGPIAERHRTTISAVAIAWTLSMPAVTAAIVGARRPEQIDGWLDAATLRLDGTDLREIEAAIQETGAGRGPSAPPV